MGVLLGDLLRRFCVEIGWSYAVFWRAVELQGRMCFVWEDGFCEQTPGDLAISRFEAMDLFIKEEKLLCGFGCQKDDRVWTLVHRRMPTQVHGVGDGVVWEAASTRNHQWILQGNLEEKFAASMGPLEMNDQFLAGIQTISVIPVLPQGVLQLGSTRLILEDIGFVNLVQQLFMQSGSVPISLLSDYNGNSFIPNILLSAAKQPSFNQFRDVEHDANGIPSPSFSGSVPLIKADICRNMSSLAGEKVGSIKDQSSIIEKSRMIRRSKDCLESFQQFGEGPSWNHCTRAGDEPSTMSSSGKQIVSDESFRGTDDQMSESNGFVTDNKLQLVSCQNAWWGDSKLVSENAHSSEVVPAAHNSEVLASGDEVRIDLQVNSENDLFDMLALNTINSVLDDSIFSFSVDIPTSITQIAGDSFSDFSNDKTACSGLFSEACSDQLLDAIVSQIKPFEKVIPDDAVSCNTSTRSSKYSCHNSPAGFAGSSVPLPSKMLGPIIAKSEIDVGISVTSECIMDRSEGVYYLGDEMFKSQLGQWGGQDLSVDRDRLSSANCKRVEEAGKLNRKKTRPGENPRPRPKDRQMIQDRFKELREIVPNGAKLSTEALLEKTIRHMLFLQSVTMHADKLKETGKSKIINKDEGLIMKDNFKGGATWALEVSDQSTICPIVVEDLKTPRHMLVEANRDVTRMEIFLSLMHLLEPTAGNVILEGNVCWFQSGNAESRFVSLQ
ncbi:Transcription factor LHW [Apostasia shenzhenica]|uniref:Transcription factor LHW n=1 Tax=Apostasia shenzhenica TaxID=1088818 RepID=A0A2I0A822_9ASPA|nr:Transcription factor LHW [Apostasia shenzhenica]